MPTDFEPRIKFEEEPDLIAYGTVRNDTFIWAGGLGWKQIGKRYSTPATMKIAKDIEDWITANQDKKIK